MEKHYVGELNTEIRVDCGRDITTASVKKILMKKPDGVVVELPPTVYEYNFLRYFTTALTFDQPGDYEIQSFIIMNGWQGLGETAKFVIYEPYS